MELRELQLYKLQFLSDITQLCDKHNIHYSLAYGTLLGAIRHGGFIPWDDDIDIIMPWKDYQKFLKIGQTELPDQYFIQNYKTDPNFHCLFTQIRVNGTTSMPIRYRNHNIHWGICIDIFPIVGKWNRASFIQSKFISLAHKFVFANFLRSTTTPLPTKLKIFFLLPKKLQIWLTDFFLWIATYHSERKENCFCLYAPEIVHALPQKLWAKLIPWNFEGKQFMIPEAYDYILQEEYGDYMTLPPADQRGGHELQLGEQIIDKNKDYREYIRELQ